MLEALKRRLRFLAHDLKHSFSPQADIDKFSDDPGDLFKDVESVKLKKKLDNTRTSDHYIANGTPGSLSNNESSLSPNAVNSQGINHEKDIIKSESESESEVDDYSQTGEECAECGH